MGHYRKEQAGLVLIDGLLIWDRCQGLLNAPAFPSQDGLRLDTS